MFGHPFIYWCASSFPFVVVRVVLCIVRLGMTKSIRIISKYDKRCNARFWTSSLNGLTSQLLSFGRHRSPCAFTCCYMCVWCAQCDDERSLRFVGVLCMFANVQCHDVWLRRGGRPIKWLLSSFSLTQTQATHSYCLQCVNMNFIVLSCTHAKERHEEIYIYI